MSKECQLEIAKSDCECYKCKCNIKKEDMCFVFNEDNTSLCAQCAATMAGENIVGKIGLAICMKNYNEYNSEKERKT